MLSHAQALITTATQMIELYREMLRSQEPYECAAPPSTNTVEAMIKGLSETREAMYRAIEKHTEHILLEGRVEELPRAISLLHWSDWCTQERRLYIQSFGLPSPQAENDTAVGALFRQSLLDAARARLLALFSSGSAGDQLYPHRAIPLQDTAAFYAVLYTERFEQDRALLVRLRLPGTRAAIPPTQLGQEAGNE